MKSIGIWDDYDWNNWKKIFINFMGSYFNMDSDNIYEDLKDYLRDSNSDNKLRVLKSIKEFLEYDELSERDKENLIREETMICYENYGLSALEWVKYIEKRLEEEVSK
jgi:hypothetical protein